MLFLAKKWIGGLIMPLPLFLLVFFIALILLLFTQKQKTAKLLLLCSFTWLFLLSFMPTTQKMIQDIERVHPPILQAQVAQHFDYILILGSAGVADATLPINSQLSATANSRFLEGLRLFKANPDAIVVVSGSGFGDIKSHAQMMYEMAIMMGIPAEQVIRLENNLDSDDEALRMSTLIKGKKAALVTSASHMQRALQLFHRYGTMPTPSPSHYLEKKRAGQLPSYYYIPNVNQLNKNTIIMHEYLGQAQHWLKQWF